MGMGGWGGPGMGMRGDGGARPVRVGCCYRSRLLPSVRSRGAEEGAPRAAASRCEAVRLGDVEYWELLRGVRASTVSSSAWLCCTVN